MLSFLIRLTCMASTVGLVFLTSTTPNRAQDFSQSTWCKSLPPLSTENKQTDPTRAAQTAFATRTYSALKKSVPASGNFTYSPFSIHTAVAMTTTGARGKTADQLMAALGYPAGTTVAAVSNPTQVYRSIACSGSYDSTTLSIANGLFLQTGKTLKVPFLKAVRDAYDANPELVDFLHHPKDAKNTINKWVADQTANKITELLSDQAITPDMKLALVNAVYIYGGWKQPFPEIKTSRENFYLSPKRPIKVPMMHRVDQTMSKSLYFAGEGFEAIGLPTADDVVEFITLVPKSGGSLDKLEAKLSETFLSTAIGSMQPRTLDLRIPKFKIRHSQMFHQILADLGAKLAVHPGADFSGIDGGVDQLFISSVIHQATVEVHEKGLEAAAATAVMAMAGAAPPKPETPLKVTVDRPFLFVIWSPRAKVPLFLGRMVDPR